MKILIIEDEPAIAANIEYALLKEGLETHHVATLRDAQDAALYDLIILDVGLPDGSGFDFARELRTKNNTPIIFLTARNDEIDRVVGLELGADDYVVKPFSPRELTARIKAVLRRCHESNHRKVSENQAYSIKQYKTTIPIEIDSKRYQITYFGNKLVLSRYEYGLLEVLARSPGRVFSRAHLMNLIWEEPDMSLERTVDTHIKTIRQKLLAVNPKDPITTHRSIGYSFKEKL